MTVPRKTRTKLPAIAAPTEVENLEAKRVRLLASLNLLGGIGLILALPFALRAGAEFFLPVTAALVVAIALVPLLEFFERRGVGSRLAAGLCVIIFIAVATFAIASIVMPAIDWVALVPTRIDRVRHSLAPALDLYKNLEHFVDKTASQISIPGENAHGKEVRIATPNSMLGLIATSAPHAAIQFFFALLVIYFFLSGWTAMRRSTIKSRGSFEGAMTTARVIQQVVEATSTYIGTISVINISLGTLTALILWMLGMPSPLMWGGIVAVFNYVPYIGPIVQHALANAIAAEGRAGFAVEGEPDRPRRRADEFGPPDEVDRPLAVRGGVGDVKGVGGRLDPLIRDRGGDSVPVLVADGGVPAADDFPPAEADVAQVARLVNGGQRPRPQVHARRERLGRSVVAQRHAQAGGPAFSRTVRKHRRIACCRIHRSAA